MFTSSGVIKLVVSSSMALTSKCKNIASVILDVNQVNNKISRLGGCITHHRGRVRSFLPAAPGSKLSAPSYIFLEILDVADIYQLRCLKLVDRYFKMLIEPIWFYELVILNYLGSSALSSDSLEFLNTQL